MAASVVKSDAPSSSVATPEPSAPASNNGGLPRPSLATRLATAWRSDIDAASTTSTTMLIYLCFLTGFTSAVTFSACFIWCVRVLPGARPLPQAVARAPAR